MLHATSRQKMSLSPSLFLSPSLSLPLSHVELRQNDIADNPRQKMSLSLSLSLSLNSHAELWQNDIADDPSSKDVSFSLSFPLS